MFNKSFIFSVFMLTIVALGLASFTSCTDQGNTPSIEIRAQVLNKGIMCPVCPGESIDQSQHPLSIQMRAMVNNKLESGWNDSDIKQFFVERYGYSVLLDPPRHGLHLIIWVVPPMVLLLMALAVYWKLRRMYLNKGKVYASEQEWVGMNEDLEIYFSRIENMIETKQESSEEES